MWRSAFARQAFQNLNASRTRIPKVMAALSNSVDIVQSSHLSARYLRFFSQHSAEHSQFEKQITDSAKEGFVHEVPFHFSEGIDEHDGAQMGNDAPLDNEPPEESLEETVGLHMDISTSGFDQHREEEGKEEVYEIDQEKLENVLSLLQSSPNTSLESCLSDMDLILHERFVIKVLQTQLIAGDNLIRFFRWAWKDKSFKVTTTAVESLVLAVCSSLRKKEIYSLWDLIKDISVKEDGVLNVEILNKLIATFSKLGKGKAAFDVFNSFGELGCVPNADTYYFTVEALCRRSFFGWAWSVCQKMLDANSLPTGGEKVGKIISWFCKGRNAKAAHTVYVAAREEKMHIPTSSINFLIGQLCQENETVQLALEMLEDGIGEDKKYAVKPYSAVVQALCRIKDVDVAKQLVLRMVAEGPPPGNAVFNYVITGYSKIGKMEQALEMMKLMQTRGLRPDVYTYTVLISAYVNGGEIEQAQKVFTEAKKKYSELSPVTYHTLIRGYCKLEKFDKALELLAEMKNFGVRPTVDEYEKLIQSFCLKALDWQMAEKLLEEMKENGLYLKGITRALITAVKEMEKEVVENQKDSLVA
ncbi:pentatricopeptide repeat-containing protein At3g02650, mitochondrial-like [Neltuma alba]|uniref:pentatricopeptide repeat-containing protein At3g02650, mitochondrial-like n=1 Tax=Neltuma alba TaxID=207710 RepID=UPI0010A51CF6|nr:pentatricopeptide repeat-containing protein At3g02650, mitochondrial-like [Prosopis alba]XP_028766720.1 pentatricopeptide repeat-containing protein At3g02650, mitochondrial-like [Prosopis alba]